MYRYFDEMFARNRINNVGVDALLPHKLVLSKVLSKA